MTTVLAIDQGTSGTKALVVAPDGAAIGVAERSLHPRYAGRAVEQDPLALLESVVDAGREAVARAGVAPDIVTLANQGETVLAWDPESGTPLTDLVVWQDRRAEALCEELGEYSETISSRTGLVLDPYFSAPKQAWIRRNLTTEGVVTTSDAWLLHRLTGAFVTDVSTASRSLVTDLENASWDAELLEVFGLGDEPLPRIVDCDEVVGHTDVFGRRVPVGGLVVDQQAALLAESCLLPGEAKCTFGTGAFLLAQAGTEPVRSSTGLSTSIAWTARGATAYCFDGQVYTAASAIRWMQQLGFIASAAELDTVAASDHGGVFAVPALAGLGAPWWRPDATGVLAGMSLSTDVGHIVLAVLQGIAAQVAELAEAVVDDTGVPLRRLRVDGGLTQSAVLMQAVADLLQTPVDVYPSQHATPLGAAALARCAADRSLGLAESIIPWQPARVFEPRWTASRAEEFRTRWRTVADTATRASGPFTTPSSYTQD